MHLNFKLPACLLPRIVSVIAVADPGFPREGPPAQKQWMGVVDNLLIDLMSLQAALK